MTSSDNVLLAVVFTLLLREAYSIRCLDCTSANNSMCLDPSLYDAETVQRFLTSSECQAGVMSSANQEFFCRKMVQTILHKGYEPEVRVTRGCAWVRSRRACYSADNEDHLETVCQCFEDYCNDAPTPAATAAWAVLTAAAAVSALGLKGVLL